MQGFVTNPNFRTLVLVDVLLVLGLLAMSNYTSVLRLRMKTYATTEGYRMRGVVPTTTQSEIIERSRRIHRNHLETVVPFLVLSVLYALTACRPILWGTRHDRRGAARENQGVGHRRPSLRPQRPGFGKPGFDAEGWVDGMLAA